MPRSKRTKKNPVPKQIQDKPESKKIANDLRKIYENPDGTMPDMKTFERSGHDWFWRLATRVLLFAGLILLAWVVWRFASPRLAYDDQVSITIEGPTSVAAGSSATYIVRYRNPDTVPVANASIGFQYPHGFVFASSTPALSGERSTIVLGSIPARSSGTAILTGRWLVDNFSTSTITAILSYTPGNFNSVFEKVASLETVANIPVATVAWNTSLDSARDKPTILTSNVPVSLSFTVKPMQPLDGPIIIAVESDDSFTRQGSEPKPDEPDIFRWTVPKLSDPMTFTVHGVFSGINPAPHFTAKVSGKSFVYAQTETQFELTSSTNRTVMLVAGKNDQVKVRPGETLPIQLSFQNDTSAVSSNLSAILYVDAPSYQRKSILDWQNITDDNNGAIKGEQINDQIRRGTITWPIDKNKTFDISLPIKDGANASLVNFGTNTITVWGEIRNNDEVLATSNKVTVTILSDLNLKATVATDNNENNYSFLLTNSFHDLKNVLVRTTLNGTLVWDESKLNVPAGTVVFSPVVNEVTWTIKDMPTSLDTLALEFGTRITKSNPTQTEYTGPISVVATDAETNEPISFTVDPIKI